MIKSKYVVLSNTEVALQCQEFVQEFEIVSEMVNDCIPDDLSDAHTDAALDESTDMAVELENLLIGATQAVFKTWYKKHTGKTLVIED